MIFSSNLQTALSKFMILSATNKNKLQEVCKSRDVGSTFILIC